MSGGRPIRDERGAFVVLWALLMVAIFGMVAIVIDLGQVREVRQENQQIADFAALAAGNELGLTGSARQACDQAFDYIAANAEDLGSFSAPNCNPIGPTCDPATPQQISTTAGEYAFTFRYPVPAAEINESRFAGGTGPLDGLVCQRLSVTVQRRAPSLFGGIFGVTSTTTTSNAVARADNFKGKEIPSLWLLDPKGCTSLDVSGGSVVRVGLAVGDPPPPGLSPPISGIITVDSNGQTCGPRYTLDTGGSGSRIQAVPNPAEAGVAGVIRLFAMPQGGASCTNSACDPSDVSGGMVSPQPMHLEERATRAPVDHAFNCKTGYPNFEGVPMDDCAAAGSVRPYIDDLRAAVGGPGVPTGFTAMPCNFNSVVVIPVGNYYCTGALDVGNNGVVTFLGGNLVVQNRISISPGGSLSVNTANPGVISAVCKSDISTSTGCYTQSSANAAFLYVRNGTADIKGGFTLNRTMLYLHDGVLDITAGAPPNWTAPKELPLSGIPSDRCSIFNPCYPFQGLALWAERSGTFTLNGGAALNLEGVYFTPNAKPFKLTGGGNFLPLKAQFIAYQLDVSGGGTLKLIPDESQHVARPIRAAILIR